MTLGDYSIPVSEFLAVNQDLIGRLQYSSFILEKHKVLYLDTPKTGCTSIKLALCKLEVDFELPDRSDSFETTLELFVHDRRLIPLKSLIELPTDAQYEVLFGDHWKRFCVVRNPFDRVFSAWFSKVLLREPGIYKKLPDLSYPSALFDLDDIYRRFESFIDYLVINGTASDPHWETQYRLLFMGQINWTAIIRYERLAKELTERGPDLNGLTLELPVANESGFRPNWKKISEKTQNAIKNLYAIDFQEFGYDSQPSADSFSEESINIATLVNAIVARNRRLEQVFQERDELRIEHQELRMELHKVYQSRSWRYTSILRKLAAISRSKK